jgi:hypothetical protein
MSAATQDEQGLRRCVRRRSAHLKEGKADELGLVIGAYAKEKDDHLRALTPAVFAGLSDDRAYRDQLVARGYESPYGLQARMWKMALKDAYETMVRYWAAIVEDIRPLVYRKRNWTDEMRHYAFWLLSNPRRVAGLYAGETPIPFSTRRTSPSAVHLSRSLPVRCESAVCASLACRKPRAWLWMRTCTRSRRPRPVANRSR